MSGCARRIHPLLWKGVLGLALLPLFPRSCSRAPQPVPAPPPAPPTPTLSLLDQADRSFELSDYPTAASAYSKYLTDNPAGPQRDRALYRLGLIYALPEYAARDSAQSISYMKELAANFPASSLRPQAELVADLEGQISQLQADVTQREGELATLRQQTEQLKTQAGAMVQLQEDLKSRDERIRQLTDELQKLKAIDLRRRPTPPPR